MNIESFHFSRTPQIIFGCGKIIELPKLIKQKGNSVLIITGARSFQQSPHWDLLQEELASFDLSFEHMAIAHEPSPQDIDKCVEEYRNKKIEVVVAIGGGSVLDAGKAISAMLLKQHQVKSYLEGVGTEVHDGQKVPFIAVPSTSGTGSETTKNAVLSEVGMNGYKKSLRHDNFVPDVALVDPELTVSCPQSITAQTGMDAFTQLLESYLSTNANTLTDSLAIKGLSSIKHSLREVVEDGQNMTARTGMAYASMISGLTLANAGLGTVHGFASAIGGYFDAPHGAVCGTLMEPVNKITIAELRRTDSRNIALHKYAKVGRMFSQKAHQNEDYHIDYLMDVIAEWTQLFEMPKLSKFGVSSADFEKIIQATGNKNNPAALNNEQMIEVLEARM